MYQRFFWAVSDYMENQEKTTLMVVNQENLTCKGDFLLLN